MKLTRSVSYALGILLRVELDGTSDPVTAARIARGCSFPPRFLYRILRRLVDARLLEGVSGPGGGYKLAKPARRITLYEIVVAMEGPNQAEKLFQVHSRHRRAVAAVNELAQRNQRRLKQELTKTTLAKLSRL